MKISDIKNSIKKIPTRAWILLLITAVGIFLRIYHFRDWLLFNPDQARDAMVVDKVLSGQKSWIILGPEVGNNRFGLGPWFYHLEIISAKIFGSAPDKMAYPDLLFSVFSIPLFYIFLKKYFSTKLSLAITALYSVSFFAVRYSRFASNPNSIPFFVLLFLLGILYLMEPDRKKSFWGAALVGIGIGVGIQLHILLFFILPTIAALFFLFLFFRKSPLLSKIGKIGITAAFILVTNTGQIAYEINHGTSNTRKFFKSTTNSTVKLKPAKNLKLDLLCQAQANWHIISSEGNIDRCDLFEILEKYRTDSQVFFLLPENKIALFMIIIEAIFSFAGYILLVYFWKKEPDWRKKIFLALVGIYGLTVFIAMFPIINQVEIRYFIVSFFLPFVFLGIIAESLLRLGKTWTKIIVGLIFVSLYTLNVSAEIKTAEKFFAQKANDEKFIYWGETEAIARFLIANSNGSKIIYLRGENKYERRYFKPLSYILASYGFDLAHPSSEKKDLVSGAPVFFVVKTRNDKYQVGDKIGKYSRVARLVEFNTVTIIIPTDEEID